MWSDINNAVDNLIETKLFANPRYANINVIKQDIFEEIKDFLLKHMGEQYTLNDYLQLKHSILGILSGLKQEYIGGNWGGLDFVRLDEDDIDPVDELLGEYNSTQRN